MALGTAGQLLPSKPASPGVECEIETGREPARFGRARKGSWWARPKERRASRGRPRAGYILALAKDFDVNPPNVPDLIRPDLDPTAFSQKPPRDRDLRSGAMQPGPQSFPRSAYPGRSLPGGATLRIGGDVNGQLIKRRRPNRL